MKWLADFENTKKILFLHYDLCLISDTAPCRPFPIFVSILWMLSDGFMLFLHHSAAPNLQKVLEVRLHRHRAVQSNPFPPPAGHAGPGAPLLWISLLCSVVQLHWHTQTMTSIYAWVKTRLKLKVILGNCKKWPSIIQKHGRINVKLCINEYTVAGNAGSSRQGEERKETRQHGWTYV